MTQPTFDYQGRGQSGKTLAAPQALIDTVKPEAYIPEPGLCDAVKVALTLGQPLLVTGEPGTGKSQLAFSIAYEFQLPQPIVFHTKTTSNSQNLFYYYDALKRFNDANISKLNKPVEDYISLHALGIAILLTNPSLEIHQKLLPEPYKHYANTRSVVLIDEIDKAPRDFPNDILNEVEKLEFFVHEMGTTFKAQKHIAPILILTSNSEKYLPDAFLRRCVFYHISFPDPVRLKEIVELRFKQTPIQPGFSSLAIDAAIDHFLAIRKLTLKKKPATAEFLAWLTILNAMQIDITKPTQAIQQSYGVLAKNNDDLNRLKKFLSESLTQSERRKC